MPPIKIFYLIGTLDVGGTERQLVEMVTRLDRRRFSPVVCCLAMGGALEHDLRRSGIPVHVIGLRGIGPKRILTNLPTITKELARLIRLLRAESPDIVHGFLFWAYVIGAFAARLARVPIVIASRRSLSLFKADRPHYLLVERFANRTTDLFIANSEAVREDAIRTEGIDPGRIRVVYNGLDIDRFMKGGGKDFRQQHDIPSDVPVVAVVANFIAYKGHTYFFDAWLRLLETHPRAVALLAGDGPTRSQLESRARASGVAGSLRFIGTCHDIPALLSACTMLVHPSLQEGFSNAIIEAMAAGRPVVVTDVGGNREAVTDGVNGLVVPPSDADALRAAMMRLLDHPELAARMGQAGQERARADFNLAAMVARYEEIYERLVRTHSTAAVTSAADSARSHV